MRYLIIFICLNFFAFATSAQNEFLKEGNIYLQEGKLEQAEEIFKKGIKKEPNNLIYANQLGLTYIEQKEFSKAQDVLEQILIKDPKNKAGAWYLAMAYYYNKRDKDAAIQFEKVLPLFNKRSGQYYSANWFIGKCYSNLLSEIGLTYDETDKMITAYEEYIKYQPDAENIPRLKEYLEDIKKRRPPSNVKRWIDQ